MILLDGKKLAQEITIDLQKKVQYLKEKSVSPTLHIYLVGNNPASETYVRMKQKKAEEIGVVCVVKKYSEDAQVSEIAQAINQDGMDDQCHGIIVQLPLPKHINPDDLLHIVDINKDVDGLTYVNQWRLMTGIKDGLVPATSRGILTILKENEIELEGKKVVVIGRSRLVGMPTALLMLRENATVTICHSHTNDLAEETKQADILIVAAGQPGLIDKNYVKKDAVIVDVGINRLESGIAGDVNWDSVKDEVKAISPVPGGVGPMTVVSLFENLLEATENTTK